MAPSPPPTQVSIAGTQVPVTLGVYPRFTGRDIKETLLSRIGLPVSRQTLFIHGEMELRDEVMLWQHGIRGGDSVTLRLEVKPNGGPIRVKVERGEWTQTVWCFEATTVEEFKEMVGAEEGWSDEKRGKMELSEEYSGVKMVEGCVGDYLVVDGSTVELDFGDYKDEDEDEDEDDWSCRGMG